jgi:hypothetical protein
MIVQVQLQYLSVLSLLKMIKFVKQIYPKELTLSTANIASDPCQFLDLDISFSEGKLNTHVYDKRRLYIPYLKLVVVLYYNKSSQVVVCTQMPLSLSTINPAKLSASRHHMTTWLDLL